MTEEFVTLETAKLLKEKGFNEHCIFAYADEDLQLIKMNSRNSYLDKIGEGYSAPTQSFAQKWLREVKNLHIEIYRNACGYGYIIVKANNSTWMEDDDAKGPNDGGNWDTYEEALEAGIFEVLKLI